MKKTFIALSLLLASFLLFASAAAEATVSAEYRELDYTLNVGGETYRGTAVVSVTPQNEVCELAAEGYTGTREDAQDLFALLGRQDEPIEEHHINKEYCHNYFTSDEEIFFMPAVMSYSKREKMDIYVDALAFWTAWSDQSRYTSVYTGYDIEWRELPEVRQTGFVERIEETYALLTCWGIDVGEPEAVIFWDAQTLQSNLSQYGDRYTDYRFEESDALIEICIPAYVNDMRLKGYQLATPDANLNNCETVVEVYMTEQEILSIDVPYSKFMSPKKTASGTPISAEQVIERYQAYLDQMLVVPEEMGEIVGILLEYNVWHRYQAGVFSPTFHLVPVWSVYTKHDYPQPTIMFNALDGSELRW